MKKEKLFSIKAEIEGAQIEVMRNIKKQKNQKGKKICMENYNKLETILNKIEQVLEKGNGVIDEECNEQETTTESSTEKPNTLTKKPEK